MAAVRKNSPVWIWNSFSNMGMATQCIKPQEQIVCVSQSTRPEGGKEAVELNVSLKWLKVIEAL